jgi:prepilin-type N-terminal cleavage/methylation domain-containing protein
MRYRMLNKNCKSRRAFSLIEMMIVLLVITILLAIAVPAYMRVRESSKAKVCKTNLRQLQAAKERWAMDNRKRDSDVPDISDLCPNYVRRLPVCPSSGRYETGTVGEPVKCSIEGEHSID